MKTALLVLPLMVLASSAMSQTRSDSLTMSCANARQLVSQRGAVVVGTGPYIYDRFVAHAGYCEITQTAEPAWVPTADDRQCPIGQRCRERGPRGGSGR
jgi:hypothetical protein